MKLTGKLCALAIGLLGMSSFTSCTPGERGALVGGAIGAGTGALIGDGTGALVGGAIGAIAGSEISKKRAARNRYYGRY
ncbi:MAG TPA: YMGG-like glycine zipper-containing protein [Verrucomicrobiales bacterium]|jgi:outer membrane lipoprotein SlyB|nr:YMGG-like glycine zipper-containing protein [Verrucomicrobiales bacterium]